MNTRRRINAHAATPQKSPSSTKLKAALAISQLLDLSSANFSTGPPCNGREERYLIVACTVITDVPEAVGPCPVALMAKVSLPLYLAFAVYS
jgi:hypothetical protein